MPSLNRRRLLTSLGTASVGCLAGCTALFDRSAPAGTLRFENDHDLPHAIRIEVTDVGAAPGGEPGEVTGDVIAPPAQRTLTASTTVAPNESERYESVFSEPVWYAIQFRLDGETPDNDTGAAVFSPVATDSDSWHILSGRVYESGEFSWVISTTDNSGAFD